MVSSLLSRITPVENESSSGGELKKYLIDEGDAVGAWEKKNVALVLFPTAETLDVIQEMASRNIDRPLILMNAEWRDGQVISDFGFGGQKKLKEDFVKSFSMVYYLQQLRILGDNVKIFKRHPGSWQVFLTDGSGESECIAVEPEKPSYEKLRLILKQAKGSSSSNANWVTRMFQELKFNADSLKNR
ncbi:hypothetical protein SELMODRAFT_429487 [Selaginella moellendorffii]|uniref:DUF1995 domain-containing protein n=1 Tax=Selaginella moellendorffii TaxID=88036 RepID=D8T6C3_SELML|nr:hypothetical protein SELMODRAFT_429487 [Selaginella moellendorffii]